MELKLEVEGAQLADEVRDLLDNLTQEQKTDLALQLLVAAMSDSESRFTKRVGIEQAIETLNARFRDEDGTQRREFRYFNDRLQVRQPNGSRWEQDWRDESGSYSSIAEFDRLTKHYAEPHFYFRETILKEMLRVAVANVEETLKGSEVVQKAIGDAVAEIESKIPDMVQNAMRQMFVDMMAQTMASQATALGRTDHHSQLLGEVIQRLDAANIPQI